MRAKICQSHNIYFRKKCSQIIKLIMTRAIKKIHFSKKYTVLHLVLDSKVSCKRKKIPFFLKKYINMTMLNPETQRKNRENIKYNVCMIEWLIMSSNYG